MAWEWDLGMRLGGLGVGPRNEAWWPGNGTWSGIGWPGNGTVRTVNPSHAMNG